MRRRVASTEETKPEAETLAAASARANAGAPGMKMSDGKPFVEDDGITYLQCACGLKMSLKVADKNGGSCMLCGRTFKHFLTSGPASAAERMIPLPIADAAPTPASRTIVAETVGACGECGVQLTKTSVGTFYPCGHGRTTPQEKVIMTNATPQDAPKPTGIRRRTMSTPPQEPAHPPSDVQQQLPAAPTSPPTIGRRAISTPEKPTEPEKKIEGFSAPADIAAQMPIRATQFAVTPEGTNGVSSLVPAMSAGQETVTVTWGKELYSPEKFHTWEVGPFSMTMIVRSDETRIDAMTRAMRELEKFAEGERARKKASYLATVKAG